MLDIFVVVTTIDEKHIKWNRQLFIVEFPTVLKYLPYSFLIFCPFELTADTLKVRLIGS